MSRICYILRYTTNNQRETVSAVISRFYSNKQKAAGGSSSSSSSSSSSDDEAVKNKKEDPLKKLNLLLQQMIQNDVVITKSTITLSHPSNKRNKIDENNTQEKPLSPEKQLSKAAKEVAESLGGDTKETESDLLKMLSAKEIQPQVKSLSDVLKGMTIDRESKPEISRAHQVRQILEQTKPTQTQPPRENGRPTRVRMPKVDVAPVPVKKIDLFGSDPLGIFTDPSKLKKGTKTHTWEKLYAKDLKLAVTHPPANYFQQMILWTEQGKLWKFPINNEQDQDEEAQVYFADHIFLEEHLEPWCPPKGPIRYFMELVCVGLSKNPYLTVKAKKEHIEWYKNYFEDKRKLLQEVGAFPTVNEQKLVGKE